MSVVRQRIAAAHAPPRAREADALAFLADLSRSLAVSIDLRETLPRTITQVRDFLDVEGIALFLLDAATQVLECKVSAGPVDVTCPLAPDMAAVLRALPWWEEAAEKLPELRLDPVLPIPPSRPADGRSSSDTSTTPPDP